MSRQYPSPVFRIEVTSSLKNWTRSISAQLPTLGIAENTQLKIIDLYFVEGSLTADALHKLSQTLLCDPVTDQYNWQPLDQNRVTQLKIKESGVCQAIEVMLRPGVTDNTANELLHAAHRLGISELTAAATGIRYEFSGRISESSLHHVAKSLLVRDL